MGEVRRRGARGHMNITTRSGRGVESNSIRSCWHYNFVHISDAVFCAIDDKTSRERPKRIIGCDAANWLGRNLTGKGVDTRTALRSRRASFTPQTVFVSVSHLVEEDNDEVVADAEVRLVELVGHVEPQALELAPLEEDRVEPREREQKLAVPERLPAPVELLLAVSSFRFVVPFRMFRFVCPATD